MKFYDTTAIKRSRQKWRRAALLALLLGTGCYRATPHFHAPLLAPGPITNIGRGSDAADTNAMAHAGWALAIPLAGKVCYGRKGLWAAGLGWLGYSVVSELWFHAPDYATAAYAPEFRADLLSRLVPTLTILAIDLLTND